ncbi:DedA family protein [Herbiconiux sp. L3-i23]|uniref:DedA family protein n=1 Tax=Herbiconiux sp. L3-i23 TaxID=2905871 RepID=UPI002072D17F|nr:DedA family protein [Herbiconiux sp. L3-i23]
MNEVLDWVLQTVRDVDPVLRTVLSGVAMFLETSILIGLIVPGDTIVIVSATGVANPVEYWSLVAVVIVGSLAGESVGFALGRFFGPRLRESRLGRRLGHDNWRRAEYYLARRGGPAVFISRFLPVLHALIPLTVGMSKMSYRRFMAWTVPACTIWAFAYISVAAAAAEGYRSLADRLHYAGYLFVGAIVGFILLAALVRWLLHRSQRRHMQDPDEPTAP